MVVDAIVENVRQRIFERVLSRDDIPGEFGSQENVDVLTEKIEKAYKERLRESRLFSDGERENSFYLKVLSVLQITRYSTNCIFSRHRRNL